jgi:hypothetical protein
MNELTIIIEAIFFQGRAEKEKAEADLQKAKEWKDLIEKQ